MYCQKCGHENENNAAYCEVCGEKLVVTVETGNQGKPKKSNTLLTMLIIIVILAVLALVICFGLIAYSANKQSGNNSDDHLAASATENTVADKDDEEVPSAAELSKNADSVASEDTDQVVLETPSVQANTEPTPINYSQVLDKIDSQYGASMIYLLYDLDGNGVKEMIVTEGYSDPECRWHVYTNAGGKIIDTGDFPGDYSMLCAANDGYLYAINGSGSSQSVYRVVLQNMNLIYSCIMENGVQKEAQFTFPEGIYLEGKHINDRSLL